MARPSRERSAIIDEHEFNRLVLKKGGVPDPQDDSPDDDAREALQETLLGKDYPDEEREDPDSVVPADRHHPGERGSEEQVDSRVGVQSSPRPGPEADLNSDTSTH